MLYQRILTAIPLIAFVIWIIFFQPSSVFFYFVLFIVLISGYEWAKLSAVKNIYIRSLYAIVITALTWSIQQYAADTIPWFIFIAVMWWFSITFYLKFAKPKAANSVLKLDKLFVAFIVFGPCHAKNSFIAYKSGLARPCLVILCFISGMGC
jgi:CDP-diglyceride synthetase